jgi:uncharacterized phage protein (TIGR02220 family)
MHYYKFNIGDYASHTSHLDPLEDIAYRRMLDWVYLHESPLPGSSEQIARLIRMRADCEEVANVLQEFFILTDHGWMQEKADAEIQAYNEKSTKAKASAMARWSKKPINSDANALRSECEGNANHQPLTINHKPSTINHKQKESTDNFNEVLLHLKNVTGRSFRESTDLKARLKDYSVEELKNVIDYKAKEWMGKDMQKYLRPKTLFNKTNIEGYLNDSNQLVPTESMYENKPNQNTKPTIDWNSTDWSDGLR